MLSSSPHPTPQLVILGYLFDNDTSFVVLLSATLGTGIEIWKVSKAFKMSIDRTKFPYIKLEDRWGPAVFSAMEAVT